MFGETVNYQPMIRIELLDFYYTIFYKKQLQPNDDVCYSSDQSRLHDIKTLVPEAGISSRDK